LSARPSPQNKKRQPKESRDLFQQSPGGW
jgi:hypothetical protein